MTLSVYVLRQLLWALFLALAGIGMLIVPTSLVKAVHEVGGVGLLAILHFLPLLLAEMVPYVLPLAFLLACVATFGRLAADNELTAIRMAGIHPWRLLFPGLVLAVLFSIGTYWVAAEVAPAWKFESRTYQSRANNEELRKAIFELNEIDRKEFSLWAESSEGNVKHNVILTLKKGKAKAGEESDGGEVSPSESRFVTARKLSLDLRDDVLLIDLEDAQFVNAEARYDQGHMRIQIPMDSLGSYKEKQRDTPKYLTSSDLRRELAAGSVKPERVTPLKYEIERRRSLAWTYVLFFLLGAPTGVLLRAGSQLGAFTCAIGYAFVYYILAMRLGKELAIHGAVPPVVAAWATNALFAVAGVALARRGLFR